MCYILCMCVCVGASGSTTVSDDPSSSVLCVVCIGHFSRGVPGGGGGGRYAPPSYGQCSTPGISPGSIRGFFRGRFFLFLAVY
jgi:hypothetical protein